MLCEDLMFWLSFHIRLDVLVLNILRVRLEMRIDLVCARIVELLRSFCDMPGIGITCRRHLQFKEPSAFKARALFCLGFTKNNNNDE